MSLFERISGHDACPWSDSSSTALLVMFQVGTFFFIKLAFLLSVASTVGRGGKQSIMIIFYYYFLLS